MKIILDTKESLNELSEFDNKENKPKILIFDIETTPLVAYAWGPKYETNLIEVIDETYILSFTAKWLDGEYITKGWPDYPGYKKGIKNDEPIIRDIWSLFNEADIVVTQNGKAFDIKTINSRFLIYGLKPPAPYRAVDTMKEAKKYLRLPSYGLDDMCNYFGIGRKQEHEGFPLWKKCIAGDLAAWKRMLKYNKRDVELTEKLYLLIRPLMKTHPNVGIYTDKIVCPVCGSGRIQSRGFAVNQTTRYKRAQCQSCGKWLRVGPNLRVEKPAVSV